MNLGLQNFHRRSKKFHAVVRKKPSSTAISDCCADDSWGSRSKKSSNRSAGCTRMSTVHRTHLPLFNDGVPDAVRASSSPGSTGAAALRLRTKILRLTPKITPPELLWRWQRYDKAARYPALEHRPPVGDILPRDFCPDMVGGGVDQFAPSTLLRFNNNRLSEQSVLDCRKWLFRHEPS